MSLQGEREGGVEVQQGKGAKVNFQGNIRLHGLWVRNYMPAITNQRHINVKIPEIISGDILSTSECTREISHHHSPISLGHQCLKVSGSQAL